MHHSRVFNRRVNMQFVFAQYEVMNSNEDDWKDVSDRAALEIDPC